MEKDFVTFYSPGTFVAEKTTLSIDNWNVVEAMKMANNITERYGATPYGFRFETHGRTEQELDSHLIQKSNFYWLGGEVRTAEEILAGTDPEERILRANVEGNQYKGIVTNTNSWKWTLPLNEDDVILDYTPPKKLK